MLSLRALHLLQVDFDSGHDDINKHKAKHEAKHPEEHHDEHSRIRHKHKKINIDGRGMQKVNLFFKDPEKGLKPYHMHWVTDKATGEKYQSWHYGSATHQDDPSYAYNNLKKYPLVEGSGYTPPPLAKKPEPESLYTPPEVQSMDSQYPYQPLETPTPSAPPFNPAYESGPYYPSVPGRYYTSGASSDMWQKPKTQSSPPAKDENDQNDKCCISFRKFC